MDKPVPESSSHRFLRVAVEGAPAHLDGGVLTYSFAETGGPVPRIGQLVRVPLRNRLVLGFVVGNEASTPDFAVKEIGPPVEPEYTLSDIQFRIAEWMSRETLSSWYACAALFLPPGGVWKSTEVYTLNPEIDLSTFDFTAAQRAVLAELQVDEELSLQSLRDRTGKRLTSVLSELVRRDVIRRWQRPIHLTDRERKERVIRLINPEIELSPRAKRQRIVLDEIMRRSRWQPNEDGTVRVADLSPDSGATLPILEALETRGAIEFLYARATDTAPVSMEPIPQLSPAQSEVWRQVEHDLQIRNSRPNLLFGVTGSGKTEIYLRAVAACLREKRSAIILVPEIALTTQIVQRFTNRFPSQVGVLHSAMSNADRYRLWRQIAGGEIRVVVGPRSALFAPVQDLGLIVIDEEHDTSYKQDNEPRYHARAVAVELAKQAKATLIMGSATPAVESMWSAREGRYALLELPQRISPSLGANESVDLPEVRIVDLRAELRAGNANLLSRELQQRIGKSVSAGEQSILLLNRRGMNTVVMCRDHGHRVECPNCDIPMVYHADLHVMVCHRCDYRAPAPQRCPQCDGRLDYLGAGTQRVEKLVRQLYPEARVLRWDADSVRRVGYVQLLRKVERHEADIIVGTQMVSKGFDLPLVTTIGVVQADSLLYLPDFRSAERTFQLLTQIAGRAGRRGPGSVAIFQTYTPEHYAIQAASQHDYERFYAEEIAFRERFRFSPFLRMARLVTRGDTEQAAATEAGLMARALSIHAWRNDIDMEILGPSPAFVAKIRNQFQYQLVIRSTEMEKLITGFPRRPGWMIDIDPESML